MSGEVESELTQFLAEVGRLVSSAETLLGAVETMTPYMPAPVKASAKVSTDELRAIVNRVTFLRKQIQTKTNGQSAQNPS